MCSGFGVDGTWHKLQDVLDRWRSKNVPPTLGVACAINSETTLKVLMDVPTHLILTFAKAATALRGQQLECHDSPPDWQDCEKGFNTWKTADAVQVAVKRVGRPSKCYTICAVLGDVFMLLSYPFSRGLWLTPPFEADVRFRARVKLPCVAV